MNTKILVACVSVVVFVGYMAVFFIIEHYKEMQHPRQAPADPNFTTKVIKYQDREGKIVEQERQFVVTTQMADPALLKNLPPPPPPTAETTGGSSAASK